jgi:hypothetical protein
MKCIDSTRTTKQASLLLMAVVCALGVAACDQPPEEADQSAAGVSLPDCASICDNKKDPNAPSTCSTGCSVERGGMRVAQTCSEYKGGLCGGKSDDPSDPGDRTSPGGNGSPNSGPHACYDGWCKPSGPLKVIGAGTAFINVSSKTHPNRKPERHYVYTYAQQQMTYRPEGAAACYPVRCSCDRVFGSMGGRAPDSFKPWGVQSTAGLCRRF